MFRSLVTGGAGFVGSHLVDRLLARGDEVVVLDSFITSSPDNLAHHRDEARLEVVRHDVRMPFHEVEGRFDRIYNLACPASPPAYQRDPVFTTMTSVLGAFHALQRAKRDGAVLFQASTSEVYGDPEVHPQSETYRGSVSCVGPRACYDEGKRTAESLCMDFHRQYGVPVRIARIFNTYGPRMARGDGRVVTNFLAQAMDGEPLTVYGDGTQTRSFCYVDDLVEGILRLTEHPFETGPMNLGNDTEFTMLELATAVADLVAREVRIEYRPLPADDPTQRRPDLSLARERLGFAPTVPLAEGLARTARHLRSLANTDT